MKNRLYRKLNYRIKSLSAKANNNFMCELYNIIL